MIRSFGRHAARLTLAALLFAPAAFRLPAQTQVEPSLIADMIGKQLTASAQDNHAYRYTLERSDSKGTVTRVEIVTPFGRIGKAIAREGKPLTPEQAAAENERLRAFIQSPADQKKKLRAETTGRKMTADITNALKDAMIFTMRPGQAQLAQFPGTQIVIDFAPNPAFHPQSTAQEALRGLAGTMWVDSRSHMLERLEAHSIRDINFILGIVAKVYTGATLEAEIHEWTPGKTAYSKLNINASVRELLFKTQHFHSSETGKNYVQLKDGLTLAEAAQILIDMPADNTAR